MDKTSPINPIQIEQPKDQIHIRNNTVGHSNQNNWYTYFGNGMFRAIRSVGKIPTNLMQVWKNSTMPQKAMHIAIAVYCTATTAYIIYLESQNEQTSIDNLHETNNASLLLVQPSLEKAIQGPSKNYNFFLNLEAEKCREQFYESGTEKTSLSRRISMHVCNDLIDKVCKTSGDMIQIMLRLKAIPESLQQKISSVREVIEDLEYIQNKFSCENAGLLLRLPSRQRFKNP
ncbi:MAG: hypothetical protein ACRCU0_06725 [Candidatus Rhabdochlamydia sp.]